MAGFGCYVIGFALLGVDGGARAPTATTAAPVSLREASRVGASSRVVVALKAEGKFLEAVPVRVPEKAGSPRPRLLKVETRTEFAERVLAIDASGRATRGARRVLQATSALDGEIRARATALRPAVSLLVAERRDESVVVFSPAGPLTRPELEIVEGLGDPMAISGLLPDRPVAVGDRWRVGRDAVRGLSGYDALATNALDATLEALDAASAMIRLKGEIRGAALGGEGTITCDGTLAFDRATGQINRLVVDRHEARKAGPVEEGLDIDSTLTVERRPVDTVAELGDAVIDALPRDRDPGHELLILIAPDGKYTMEHERSWHIYWDDPRLTVLKQLDHGEVIAQCNLNVGPKVARGKHQDPDQFRDDVRRALGKRFVEFVGVGEVEGDPAGGYRYKVGVRGRHEDVGIVWDYFLIASPEGDQVLATFTYAAAQAHTFGDQDLRLIGSFRWTGGPGPKP